MGTTAFSLRSIFLLSSSSFFFFISSLLVLFKLRLLTTPPPYYSFPSSYQLTLSSIFLLSLTCSFFPSLLALFELHIILSLLFSFFSSPNYLSFHYISLLRLSFSFLFPFFCYNFSLDLLITVFLYCFLTLLLFSIGFFLLFLMYFNLFSPLPYSFVSSHYMLLIFKLKA